MISISVQRPSEYRKKYANYELHQAMSVDFISIEYSLGSLKKFREVGRCVSFNLSVNDTQTLFNDHLFYVFFFCNVPYQFTPLLSPFRFNTLCFSAFFCANPLFLLGISILVSPFFIYAHLLRIPARA